MINFDFDQYCSGCGTCFNVCPVEAIIMRENDEGFLMPEVESAKCIHCGRCEQVCPHLNREKFLDPEKAVKAVWLYSSKNDTAKMKSSSGAACFDLGQKMIESGGYLAGCVWNKQLKAVHQIGCDMDFVMKTQGSKYVQSETGFIYKKVIELLKGDGSVLFTGTPCQAAAMHNIVMSSCKNRRDQLVTLGVICHGVSSPAIWESYKKYDTERVGSPIVTVNFRDKSKEGYKKSYCRYDYADGRTTYLPTYLPSSKYIEATLVYNLSIRNSCCHCDCKGINRGVDVIVGDWYAEYQGEGKLGTSCIVANTEHGKEFVLGSLSGLRNFSYELILQKNTMIEKSIGPSPNRSIFLERIKDYHYWDKVEELYPPKYKYKKLLVKFGLFDLLKRVVG